MAFSLTTGGEARVNLFQFWHPGMDTAVGPIASYDLRVAALAGENLAAVPVAFSYVPAPRLEAGAQWGLRSTDSRFGISDILLAAKYHFISESAENPAVIAEAGVSLPAADYENNLGSGSTDFLFQWALEKSFDPFTGYFGLGFTLNGKNGDQVQAGNCFVYRIGCRYPARTNLHLYGELKGVNHAALKVNNTAVASSDYQELYLAPGADFWFMSTPLSASFLFGLTPESHDIGVYLAASF
jgi:hypothetical protein